LGVGSRIIYGRFVFCSLCHWHSLEESEVDAQEPGEALFADQIDHAGPHQQVGECVDEDAEADLNEAEVIHRVPRREQLQEALELLRAVTVRRTPRLSD
jgi:hypothetical protein